MTCYVAFRSPLIKGNDDISRRIYAIAVILSFF